VDDAAMASLNRTYRGVAGPTDVLAFPMTEGRFASSWPDLLGDVVISAETARRQARPARGGVRAELALLLVHGILHLVGYDHGTATERRRMWQKQREILAACGIRVSAARRRPGPPASGRRA
jgi:probable rRNA maturation factor